MLTTIRRIDEMGRIALPKDIRREMDIVAGDPLKITCDQRTCTITPLEVEKPVHHALDILSDALDNYFRDTDTDTQEIMRECIHRMRQLLQKSAENRRDRQ